MVAALVAFALSPAIVALAGHSVVDTATAFYEGSFGLEGAGEATLKVAVPLVLIGIAWIVAISANQINLGLEGQILAGGVGATLVGLKVTGIPQPVHLPLAVCAGALGGAAWAGIAAWLSVRRGVSELLSTFMLNFVALLAVSWLVRGSLQDPTSTSLLQTTPVELSASWPRISAGLTWDIVLVPLAAVVLTLIQRRTTAGFRLRLLTANPDAARDAGVPTVKVGALALLTSGAIAGVVGSSLILASTGGVMTDGFSNNYGFLGIAVALLARNSPLGCIAAGLLFAALQQGGGLVETRVGVPSALVQITQGVVIVVLAASAFLVARGGRFGRLGGRRLALAGEDS